MNEMNDNTGQPETTRVEAGQAETGRVETGRVETGRVETGQGVAGPVLEGVVVGHATCARDGCTAAADRVSDPFALEVHGEQVEIDLCEQHLAELYDEI